MSNLSSDDLGNIAQITKRIDDLKQMPALSKALKDLNNTAELQSLKSITTLAKQIEDLNRATALYDKLINFSKNAAIYEEYKTINKIINSFNLYPTSRTYEALLNSINYSASIERAIAKDWQKVSKDLWKSYLTVYSSKPPDDHERTK